MTSHITASDQLPCRFPVVLPLGLSHFRLLPADISSGFSVPSFCLSINRLSSTSHLSITFLSIFTHYLSINHLPVNQSLPIMCHSIMCLSVCIYCLSIIYLSINLYLYLYLFVNHIPVNQSCICQSINLYLSSINPLQTCQSHICLVCVLIYHLSISNCISVSAVS